MLCLVLNVLSFLLCVRYTYFYLAFVYKMTMTRKSHRGKPAGNTTSAIDRRKRRDRATPQATSTSTNSRVCIVDGDDHPFAEYPLVFKSRAHKHDAKICQDCLVGWL